MNDKKPSSIHSKKLRRMSRRRILQTLSAAGFSSAAVANLSVEDVRAADSDQVPISIDTEGNTIINVDSDWYDDLLLARQVVDRLSANWLGSRARQNDKQGQENTHNDVLAVWLDAGSNGQTPHAIVTINAESESKGETQGKIPGKINGVSVEIEEAPPSGEEFVCDTYGKSNTSTVPGGLRVTFSGPEGNANGTLTPRVVDSGGDHNYALMTCAHVPHVAYGVCGNSLIGKPAYHNGSYIGEIVYVNHSYDYVIIYDSNNETRPQSEVWNPSDHSERYDIIGTLSADGIDYWINEGRNVRKLGVGTCKSTGKIHARGKKEDVTYNDDCAPSYYHCVRWGTYDHIGPGDSGSITFGANPGSSGGNYAVSINTSRWWNYSFGTAGYRMRNINGYRWDNL